MSKVFATNIVKKSAYELCCSSVLKVKPRDIQIDQIKISAYLNDKKLFSNNTFEKTKKVLAFLFDSLFFIKILEQEQHHFNFSVFIEEFKSPSVVMSII